MLHHTGANLFAQCTFIISASIPYILSGSCGGFPQAFEANARILSHIRLKLLLLSDSLCD